MHAAPFLGGLAEPVSALIQDDKNAEPQPCLGMFVPGIPSRRRGILNLGNWRLLYIVLDLLLCGWLVWVICSTCFPEKLYPHLYSSR